MAGSPRRLVWNLALADLRHERNMTACTMLAITAVVAPLLILFGLKFGTIETLRQRLLQDPLNRQIQSTSLEGFDREYLDGLRERPDVEVVIPLSRIITSEVRARLASHAESAATSLALVPTLPGDPLLLGNGVTRIPVGRQAVLSATAGEKLGARVGETLTLTVVRFRGGKQELGTAEFPVIGILDARAEGRDALYADLTFVEQVEAYKEGSAVPEMGWNEGGVRKAYEVYDGAYLVMATEISPETLVKIRQRSGFSSLRPSNADEFLRTTGLVVPPESFVYFLEVSETRPQYDRMELVRRRLVGLKGHLVPFVQPFEVQLAFDGGVPAPVLLRALGSVEVGGADSLGHPAAWPSETEQRLAILDGPAGPSLEKSWVEARFESRRLKFPLTTVTQGRPTAERALFVPHRLAARVALLRERDVSYVPEGDELLLARKGYEGFRLYVRTLDDVDPLRLTLQEQGLRVTSNASRILQIKRFDQVLTVVFLIIASAAVAGAAASLASNYIAAVERKRKELSVLRLIGFSGLKLLRFPLYQAVVVALGGLGGAFLIFFGLAALLNHLAVGLLEPGEQACRLTFPHAVLAAAGTVLLAMAASLFAGRRAASVDPAVGLRSE